MGDVVDVINNIGFPITVSVALFYQNIKTQDTIMTAFKEFKGVIEQNNVNIQSLEKVIRELGGDS